MRVFHLASDSMKKSVYFQMFLSIIKFESLIYYIKLSPISPGNCHLNSFSPTKFFILTTKQYQFLEYLHLLELYLYQEFPFLLPSFFFCDASEEGLEDKVLEVSMDLLIHMNTKLTIKRASDLISRWLKICRFIFFLNYFKFSFKLSLFLGSHDSHSRQKCEQSYLNRKNRAPGC